jgi:hypothetical protein
VEVVTVCDIKLIYSYSKEDTGSGLDTFINGTVWRTLKWTHKYVQLIFEKGVKTNLMEKGLFSKHKVSD